jgi:hypothetical protein
MRKIGKHFFSSHRILALLVGVLCFAFIAFPLRAQTAAAQSPGTNWDQAVNLSNSGSALDPLILADENNLIHAIWNDTFLGFRYSQSANGGDWTAPVTTTFPFGRVRPRLLLGPDKYIFAFWRDGTNSLHSSRVQSDKFSIRAGWEDQGIIAPNTLAFDVFLDENNTINVVFVSTGDTGASNSGVFFRQSTNRGGGWGNRIAIYSSLYYRGITATNAHISIAALNGVMITAWDDPFLHKILYSQSSVNGLTWETPKEISASPFVSSSSSPIFASITAWNGQFMMVWLNNSTENICSVLYQVMTPSSGNWSEPQNLIPDQSSCPSTSGFLAWQSDILLWQETVNNQIYFVAWDGTHWSSPQIQTDLAGFRDPVTSRTLTTACRYIISLPLEKKLGAIVCDDNGNKDVWFFKRSLGQAKDWFSPNYSWEKPAEIRVLNSTNKIDEMNVLTDSDGNFHAFWTQPQQPANDQASGSTQTKSIYYSTWSDGEKWSDPVEIYSAATNGLNQVAVAISSQNEIFLVRQGSNPWDFFFTKTQASRAYSPIEWVKVVKLPTAEMTSSSPVIAAGDLQNLFVVYAVPVNESRGIYMVHSSDDGETWDQPIRIFDAQAAGWEMADHPAILITQQGRLHILWRRETPLEPVKGIGLGYSYSDDGGKTWSAADLSVSGGQIQWSDLVPLPQGQLFRAWLDTENNQPEIISQVSVDNGQTWQDPVSVVSSGTVIGNPSLVSNGSGVHLLQLNGDTGDQKVMRHWIWYNNNWVAGDTLDISLETVHSIGRVASSISTLEKIGIVFSASDIFETRQSIYAVINSLGGSAAATPAVQNTPGSTDSAPTAIPSQDTPVGSTADTTSSPAPENTLTPKPENTQTLDLSGNGKYAQTSSNSWAGLILGIILSAGTVIAIFWYRLAGLGNKSKPKK